MNYIRSSDKSICPHCGHSDRAPSIFQEIRLLDECVFECDECKGRVAYIRGPGLSHYFFTEDFDENLFFEDHKFAHEFERQLAKEDLECLHSFLRKKAFHEHMMDFRVRRF